MAGIEIRYDLYNPTVHKIEVLKLEKRLDDELFYLRDAAPEYSTFPFDMDPVPLPLSSTVPVNPLKVAYQHRDVLITKASVFDRSRVKLGNCGVHYLNPHLARNQVDFTNLVSLLAGLWRSAPPCQISRLSAKMWEYSPQSCQNFVCTHL